MPAFISMRHRWYPSVLPLLIVSLILTLLAPLLLAAASPASGALDGPGALSHFDLACKDRLGTARNTTSKVWFTIANGVLSDVYYPTLDNTNVETLQYIVTDGSTFTDLQTRATTYTVRVLDQNSQARDCEVTTLPRAANIALLPTTSLTPTRIP